MKTFIWGCDLSLSNSGIAILDDEKNVVVVFSIKTNPKEEHKIRLKQIGEILLEYREKYPPKKMIIENAFTRFNKATQALYKCRGLVEYLFSDVEMEFLAPTTIKKIITGSGKAEKTDVENSIRKMFPNIEILNNDCSDALAAGATYFINR